MKEFPRPIQIKIYYDEKLQKIIGKDFEQVVISENLRFIELLYFIFSTHPEIPRIFPPGTLGLLLNNRPPKEDDPLKSNDKIKLMVGVNLPTLDLSN